MFRTVIGKLLTTSHGYMYRHDLGPVPDCEVQLDRIETNTYFVPCKLGDYERWVNEAVDIPSLPQVSAYSGQTEAGTIVFWTTREGVRVGSTAVSTVMDGTVYACTLPKLLGGPPPKGSVFEGLNETAPEFRRKGVYAWQQMLQLRLLREHGFTHRYSLEPGEQEGPRRVQERNGSVLLGQVAHLQFPRFVRSRLRVSLWTSNRHLAQVLRRLA